MPAQPNYLPGMWDDLRTAINAVWPEVTENFRELYIRRINWANFISDSALMVPYVVMQIQPMGQQMDMALDNTAYLVRVSLFYIDQETIVGGPSATGIMEVMEAKALAMQMYLVDPTTQFNTLQVWEDFVIDVSADSQVNMNILLADMPLYGLEISFSAMVGSVIQ